MISKRVLSIILLSLGVGLVSLTGLDVLIYGLETEWNRALTVFLTWGFIGIGLTMMGTGLFVQSKLEQA